jgi:hypothetical protein
LPANKENDLAKELEYHKQKIDEAEDEKKKKKSKQFLEFLMRSLFGRRRGRHCPIEGAPAAWPTNSECSMINWKMYLLTPDCIVLAKYHMVRFFERKKADRLAKQIETQISLSKDPEEIEKLNQDLHVAQIDSLYAKFFPVSRCIRPRDLSRRN